MIIRDPLYGDMVIKDEVIKKLISTFEFQRLRKIKQLGLTYLIFPSAEHSRYTHSLGVYHLSIQITDLIAQKRGMLFDKDEMLAFQIACLLHDVGHGPFSHTTEEVFALDHEKYSVDIIKDKSTEINKVLSKECPHLINSIAAFIEKKHENKTLVSIISSTIDIDRMDYLMRDSHFAGVVYGKFDVMRMINIIDIVDDKIVFLEKGIRTLEDFILSRYHMFCQVYLNQKTIFYETLCKSILDHTRTLYNDGYRFKTNITKLVPYLKGEPKVSDYLQLNDLSLITIIDDFAILEKDEKLRKLARHFQLQKPFLCEKEPGKSYIEFSTNSYHKVLYSEVVTIKMGDGSIKRLEDVSPLINFAKNDLEIKMESKEFYIEDYEI